MYVLVFMLFNIVDMGLERWLIILVGYLSATCNSRCREISQLLLTSGALHTCTYLSNPIPPPSITTLGWLMWKYHPGRAQTGRDFFSSSYIVVKIEQAFSVC